MNFTYSTDSNYEALDHNFHPQFILIFLKSSIFIKSFHKKSDPSEKLQSGPKSCQPHEKKFYSMEDFSYIWTGIRITKDWAGKKVTILYSKVLIVKSSGIIQFFYLHFT